MLSKRYWLVVVTYILMLASTAIVPLILYFSLGMDPITSAINTNLVGFIIGLVVIVLIMKQNINEERIANPISIGKIIGWSLLGVFLAWTSQIIAVTIEIEFFGIDPASENTELIVDLTRINPLFILIPAIIAPVVEELVFRKVLFGTLYKRFNFFWGALISSVIFGVLHTDFVHLLIYVTMGFVFAFLYVKTKRIIVPIITHMTMNTVTVLAQLFIDPEQLEQMQNNVSLIFLGG